MSTRPCAPLRKTGQIKIHGPAAFDGMRKAGALAAECLDMLAGEIKPGVTTERIDRLVFEFAMDHGAVPATLMYRGYRKSTCTSINHVVCHGIPGEKPLRDGDIVNVDVTLILDGWHGNSSRMYSVGEIPRRAERLIEVTYEAMMRGIAVIRPGATTGDIGHAIQTYVEAQHMSVVRDFCGHGLGQLFHDEPNIVHVGRPGEGIVLKPGMFFTVEPMINLGRPHVKVLSDGWTAVTRDRSLSAQFEHSVGGDRHRRRGLHPLAQGIHPAALPHVSPRAPAPRARRLQNALIRSSLAALPRRRGGTIATSRSIPWMQKPMDAKKRESERDPAAALPHYHGHRERLRERFRDRRSRCALGLRAAGSGAVPRPAAARRQAARQDADRDLRFVRGSDRAHRRRGSPRSRAWARPRSPSSRSSRRQRAGCCAAR